MVDDSSGEICRKTLIVFTAEVLGTAILMFYGCMGYFTCDKESHYSQHFSALAFGLTVMVAMQIMGHVSGAHINPQISIAALILGQLDALLAVVYIFAQFVGSILGYGLLKLLTPCDFTTNLCMTSPHCKVTITQAVFVEMVMTFVLVLVFGAITDARNKGRMDSMPLRFGLTVAVAYMVAGPYTGASLNSARSFAPALFNNNWENQWIYWVGPTVGSIMGALFYRLVLQPPLSMTMTIFTFE